MISWRLKRLGRRWRGRSTGSRRRRRGWRVWRGLVIACGVFLIGLSGYAGYLDYQVRTKFEGKRWSIPARVYARPLELYPGLPLTAETFARELDALQYRYAKRIDAPGTYYRSRNEFLVHRRFFDFWDGSEPGRQVRIVFDGDFLSNMYDMAEERPLELLRMDPVMIGGIYPAHNEDRILVKRDQVPALLIDTLLAIEDRSFYQHAGVVPLAILRAMWANFRAGGTVQGGSTLTQQLVKNFFLSNRRTLWRKFNEAIMALEVEWHYGKDEILEAYLNEIYLGQDGNRAIHGFGLASQFYFERPLSDLTPEQIALMVGVVKGPSFFDPRRFPERARERRDLVLDVMVAQNRVSPQTGLKARSQPLGVVPHRPSGITPYPAFLDLVRRQLRRDYRDEDLTSEGLRVFTTMDPQVQEAVENALRARLPRLETTVGHEQGTLEGAVVVTTTEGGEVLAVAGGRDPKFAGFNRALDASRPVGSLIKPAVFLTALGRPEAYTLATMLDDSPFNLEEPGRTWSPANYDRLNHGAVPLYAALVHSYNVATARLGTTLGVEAVRETLRRLGVARELNPYPSLLLGATGLAPLDVAQMYQTLAAGGFRTPLKAIREVTTGAGEPLQRYPLVVEQAFDPAQVYLITDALQRAVMTGTGRALYNVLPAELAVAGKTGTTDDLRDSWFAGFTGDRLAVVWIGNDENQPTGLTGASGALRVWGDIMAAIGPQPLQPVPPLNIEREWIDYESGLRADERCSQRVELPFIEGTAPRQRAPCAPGAFEKTFQWMKGLVR